MPKDPRFENQVEPTPPLPMRSDILRTAESLVNGERRETFGPPEESFGRIANLLSAMGWGVVVSGEGEMLTVRKLTATDAALGLVQVKIARAISSPDHEDSYVDAAGYIALAGELGIK